MCQEPLYLIEITLQKSRVKFLLQFTNTGLKPLRHYYCTYGSSIKLF